MNKLIIEAVDEFAMCDAVKALQEAGVDMKTHLIVDADERKTFRVQMRGKNGQRFDMIETGDSVLHVVLNMYMRGWDTALIVSIQCNV